MRRNHKPNSRSRLLNHVIAFCLFVLAAASFLPFVETNTWWIRYLDFLRVQVLVGLLLLLLLQFATGAWRGGVGMLAAVAALAGVAYHATKLLPYSALAEEEAIRVASCEPASSFSIAIANVQKTNRNSAELARLIADADPDVLLLMETSEWWDERIAEWPMDFPHRVQHIPEEATFFGMHLLSKLPLVDPQVEFFFGAETPTIVSGVRLDSGQLVQLIGIHPRPPQSWSQPTTLRDGHLLTAAIKARDSEHPAVIGGDFNATPWERITRRAIRIGGLLDPRIGRGIHPTYHWWGDAFSWPLDQILFQEDLALMEFSVLPDFGSDHLPVLAELCHSREASELQSPVAMREDDLEEAQTSISAARELTPSTP